MSEQSSTRSFYNREEVVEEELIDLEWEEWDGQSPYWHHCIAGSIAGVAEHTLLYPVDTVKTHMQAYCSTCPNKSICADNTTKLSKSSKLRSGLNSGSAASATTSAGAKTGQNPHGMWLTMRNLIQHGYSTQPATLAVSSSSSSLKATQQRSATLTASPLSHPSEKSLLTESGGYSRLWRGVQTMAVGCIPAHALYFSVYEEVKSIFATTVVNPSTGGTHTYLGTIGASIAGAASTFSHDVIMTPLDTIKQRMQLGHYEGMGHAFTQIWQMEGLVGFYRSFGVTLLTNVPYGMVMVSTNEFLRSHLLRWKERSLNSSSSSYCGNAGVLDISTTMMAGCGAGMAAAAVTTPLDRVKTRLQTQKLGQILPRTCPNVRTLSSIKPEYAGLSDAFQSIVREEGAMGLCRGLVPRLMTHTPAVAISWTSYESAKRWLANNFDD